MGRIKTKLDVIYNENVKRDIVILHMSDIHFNKKTSNRKLNKIKDYVNNVKADYVMITGDLIDDTAIIKDKNRVNDILLFLTGIAKNTKILFCLGNHDIVNDEDYKFFNKINDLYNIYLLNNSSYEDDRIYVSGLTLPTEYYYNITKDESVNVLMRELHKNSNIVNKLPKDKVKVMLVHSPLKLTNTDVLDKLVEYDLILSGHTHGGIVPSWMGFIFKDRGIISPSMRLFPKCARGRVDSSHGKKKLTIIINDSVTRLSRYPNNIFCIFNFMFKISLNKIIIRKG